MITATQLFGGIAPHGGERCFFCGGLCDRTYATADYVLSSFTARDGARGGECVCGGCVAAMNERADIAMIDGERRVSQKVRCYSWIVQASRGPIAATKGHRKQLTAACLDPPDAPYAICLSESGQRHLLYQTPVVATRDGVLSVALEGRRLRYTRDALLDALSLCRRVVAVVGKPALAEGLSAMQQMRIVEEAGEDTLSQWQRVERTDVAVLASWLCPGKEECTND